MMIERKYYDCYDIEEIAGEVEEASCYKGACDVDWLRTGNINTSRREYQREKVATVEWKQGIMTTVLETTYVDIPEIHIRVICIPNENGEKRCLFELVDGQQRVTAILDYLSDNYPLPDGMTINGDPVGGLKAYQLQRKYGKLYNKIIKYTISCTWYCNISNNQTADLFINKLNNTNTMKPQEIRNAIQGALGDWIRNTARGWDKPDNGDPIQPHPLFEREYSKTKSGEIRKRLKHFSKNFKLRGRMEVDEWLSELVYLYHNGSENGINHKVHINWLKSSQSGMGKIDYSKNFEKSKKMNVILNKALLLLKETPEEHKGKLNSMTTQMMILYYLKLENEGKSIKTDDFSKAFFDTYVRWSDEKEKRYMNETDCSRTQRQMPPFKELFGGKNSNAIKTIFKVLDMDWEERKDEIGLKTLDHRNFSRDQILAQAKEQGWKDYYTGENLNKDDMVGDHKTPRSFGIEAGGVTEISNLAVCSRAINSDKGNTTAEEYLKKIKSRKAA